MNPNQNPQAPNDVPNTPQGDEADVQAQVQDDHEKTFSDFKTLFKRKNANVKRKITLTFNALKPLENNTDTPCHPEDIAVVRRHVQKADSALESLNEVIDEVVELFDQNRIEPFTAELADHVPSIMGIRARINAVEARTKAPDQPPNGTASHLTSFTKIDTTFKPDPLDTTATPSMFEQWKDQFDVYARRNGFLKAPIKDQCILLNQCLTPLMASTLKKICSANEATDMNQLMGKIEKFLLRSNNLVARRFKYFNCIQNDTESIGDYIIRFRDIGDHAAFENFSYEDNMACRLITGIKDETLKHELLRLKKTDFQTVQEFALAWQDSRQNASSMKTDTSSEKEQDISKISAYKSNQKKHFNNKASQQQQGPHNQYNKKPPSKPDHQPSRRPCGRCAYPHHPSAPCPASGQTCGHCKKPGHLARACLAARKGRANRNSQSKVSQVEEHFPDVDPDNSFDPGEDNAHDSQPSVNVIDFPIFQVSESRPPTPRITVSLLHITGIRHEISALPDTGAVVSVLPSTLIRSWNLMSLLQSTSSQLRSVGGDKLQCDGTIVFNVTVEDCSREVEFFVCPFVKTVILSWSALRKFDVISSVFPRRLRIDQVQHTSHQSSSLKKFCIDQYPRVFSQSGPLLPMKGPNMAIHLKDNIDYTNTNSTYKPRPIPIPLRDAAKSELDKMLNKDIIRPVSQPTHFLSPMLVVPKKQGTVRLVVDYTELNKHVQRPIHPFPSVSEVKALIPASSKFFATLDATKGYWQIPLQEESQLLTTFLTPWGRFCFKRAPMGLSASGDEFCRRGDIAFQGIPGMIKVVDDILIYAPSYEQLKTTIFKILETANANGITLSPEKFTIGTSVTFVGLEVSSDGITPDQRHLRAIAEFPRPKNRTDLRSFFGLINQFSSFSKEIAAQSKSLRPLLASQSSWEWSEDHDDAFIKLRKLLVSAPILQYFSPQRQTKLLTDASRLHGLGFALMQKQDDRWVLIACGSRFLTTTESNYAVCELEALAIVWAVLKCRIYLLGLPSFTVVTDHRPLVSIFNASRLAQNDNPRLVRLLQKVATYSFMVEWVPGKLHRIPDALSRAPVCASLLDNEPTVASLHDILAINMTDPSIQKISKQAADCPQYQDLCHAVQNSDPSEVKRLPIDTHGHVRAFASVWHRLSIHAVSGLILLDSSRIVVPIKSRSNILKLVHSAHQGINRTKARLQSLYFWHGMSNDATQMVQACQTCQEFQASQPAQPLSQAPMPSFPFQSVSCDLFDYRGAFSLVYVDRFSGWPLVAHFSKSPSSSQIIAALSSFFRDFGIPVSLRHDGAKPLVSQDFTSFLKNNNVRDELASAYNPQSNGHAEAAVKAVKKLVKKCWMVRQLDLQKFNNALLEWRNTPRMPGMRSPAELLFCRKLRTLLPAISYQPISRNQILKAVRLNYEALARAYNKSNFRRCHLPPLSVGDKVRVRDTIAKNWFKEGIVCSRRDNGLSYVVKIRGKTFLRNRRLLKKIPG